MIDAVNINFFFKIYFCFFIDRIPNYLDVIFNPIR